MEMNHIRNGDYTLLEERPLTDDGNEGDVVIQIHDESSTSSVSEPLLEPSDSFPEEKLKTLVSLIWIICGLISTSVTTSFVHEMVPSDQDPLPDVFFKHMDRRKWAFKVSETLGLVLLITFFTLMLFHKHRFIIMRRAFILVGLLYLMRCVTMVITILPVPDTTLPCAEKVGLSEIKKILSRALLLFSGAGLSITGVHQLCGDYIYSGHTFMLLITHMFINEYTPSNTFRHKLLHFLTFVTCYSGILLVLIAHEHYTIDVVIAYWLATRLFWYYHAVANNKTLQNKVDARNFLNREFWFPFLEWSERNVRGIIPHEYEIPMASCLLRTALVLRWPVPIVRKALASIKFH